MAPADGRAAQEGPRNSRCGDIRADLGQSILDQLAPALLTIRRELLERRVNFGQWSPGPLAYFCPGATPRGQLDY